MSDITLTPGLPAPTDLPELPAAAGDRLWDVAARLTGAGEIRASAGAMIEAGANREDVIRALTVVDRQAQALAELLDAVESVIETRSVVRSEDPDWPASTLEGPMLAVRAMTA